MRNEQARACVTFSISIFSIGTRQSLEPQGPDIDIFSIGLDTNTSRTLRLSRSILKNAIRQL
jgi:hypothetical protein